MAVLVAVLVAVLLAVLVAVLLAVLLIVLRQSLGRFRPFLGRFKAIFRQF